MLKLKLLNDYNNHISTKTLWKARRQYVDPIDFDKNFPVRWYTQRGTFGIADVAAGLEEVEGDINQKAAWVVHLSRGLRGVGTWK